MQEFRGKVAVVTGGASGIGRALVDAFVREGMKVVIADVEQTALDSVVAELRGQGHDVTGVVTDVARLESVEALARRSVERYGKVHVLCNNAGVAGPLATPIWETTDNDWRWILGVNTWGVIHGIRVFLPLMLAHGEEGHVVNTASVAGLVASNRIYSVSKHATVAVSEYLDSSLKQANARIKTSVVCPGFVRTQIRTSARNRPPDLRNARERPPSEAEQKMEAVYAERTETGMAPEEVAAAVLQAIRTETFWVLPQERFDRYIRARTEDVLARRNPK